MVGPLLFVVIRLAVNLNAAEAGLGNRVVRECPAHVVEQPGDCQYRRGRTVPLQMVQEVLGVGIFSLRRPGEPLHHSCGILLDVLPFAASLTKRYMA